MPRGERKFEGTAERVEGDLLVLINSGSSLQLFVAQVGQRLSTLEQSIQELADLQRPDTGYGAFSQVFIEYR